MMYPKSVSAEGSIAFVRSPGSDGRSCICCEGDHVCGMRAELEGVEPEWFGEPVTRVGRFVERFLWSRQAGKPVFEGKRFRVTVDILDDEKPRNAIERVAKVAGGDTINGAYKLPPGEALEAFRADLRDLVGRAGR
jgi:hypothetical protein